MVSSAVPIPRTRSLRISTALIRLRKNMDLADEEVLAGEDGFFKAAAVGAVALVLDDVEQLVALVALGHAGHDVDDELGVFQKGVRDHNGVELLDVPRDNQRQLADIQNDLGHLVYAVFPCKIGDGLYH